MATLTGLEAHRVQGVTNSGRNHQKSAVPAHGVPGVSGLCLGRDRWPLGFAPLRRNPSCGLGCACLLTRLHPGDCRKLTPRTAEGQGATPPRAPRRLSWCGRLHQPSEVSGDPEARVPGMSLWPFTTSLETTWGRDGGF